MSFFVLTKIFDNELGGLLDDKLKKRDKGVNAKIMLDVQAKHFYLLDVLAKRLY